MDRFHIVIFNYNRINLFLNNFFKIKNFNKNIDKIYIIDCSKKYKDQEKEIFEFIYKNDFKLNKNFFIIKRKNWGIDQGARIDYFIYLKKMQKKPKYIWQFQEHYLDTESEFSKWNKNILKIGGQIKKDIIPDNFEIDLDYCEKIYENNYNIKILFANREGLNLFPQQANKKIFFTDGANFSIRTDIISKIFTDELLKTYKNIYDSSYLWALFMEIEYGKQLTNPDFLWYDLVTQEIIYYNDSKYKFNKTNYLEYVDIYNKYKKRADIFLNGKKIHKLKCLFNTKIYFIILILRKFKEKIYECI